MLETGFGPGTQIATQDGALPIEWLEPGDQLVRRGGPPVQVLGVERCHLPYPACLARPDAWPSEIAFRPPTVQGRLTAVLTLAPRQPLLVTGPSVELNFGAPEMLVEARDLGAHLRQSVPGQDVTLYRLRVSRPALILANGLWCAAGDALPAPCLSAWEVGLLAPQPARALPRLRRPKPA